MRVRDLIKDTVWRPGRDYDGARPLVSVLMPTFRRAHDGSFLNAVDSILTQTLHDIELIIVDDGSTDGTAQQIEAITAADGRVSCLRHPENIGLPAVSEYEAFLRARAEFIAFGFDDFIFEPNALSELLAFSLTSGQSVVHGDVGWFDSEGKQHFYGRDPIPYEQLRSFNFLANAGFLVPRAILEDVGLFDPHIAAARVCDWDLWRRMFRKYPIYRAPILVGIEYGITREDSLGNTYPLLEESLQEYFGADRDELLKPHNFPDLDVWRMPEAASALLTTHVLGARQFFPSRQWARSLSVSAGRDAEAFVTPGRSTIGIFGVLDFSIAMIFDALPGPQRQGLLHVHPGLTDAQLVRALVPCSAVIMVRHLLDERSERVRLMCAAMEIPLYYLDNNKPVAPSNNAPEFGTTERLKSILRDFSGVLCTSAPLATFIRENWLHSWVREVSPVFDRTMQEKFDRNRNRPTATGIRIGIIGGQSRTDELVDIVSALGSVGGRVSIEVVTDRGGLPELPFPVHLIEPTASLDEFLTRWKPLGSDILIHARGSFDPSAYQNKQLLLIARYLGAVPLVCGDASVHTIEAAILAACDGSYRTEKRRWLEAHCASAFVPDQTIAVLAEIRAGSPPVDTISLVVRLRKMLDHAANRAVLAEGELRERSTRLARTELELASRTYRVALLLRRPATWIRKMTAWFRPR